MNKFMELAIKEAVNGIKNNDGGPFGAVIVKDGKVIAKAHNCVLKNKDATCHGEMQAIRKASKKLGTFDLSGCEIYTTGYPCPMCSGAILWANIEKVYFGCDMQDAQKLGFRDKRFQEELSTKLDNIFQIDKQNCLKVYEKYEQLKGKADYWFKKLVITSLYNLQFQQTHYTQFSIWCTKWY